MDLSKDQYVCNRQGVCGMKILINFSLFDGKMPTLRERLQLAKKYHFDAIECFPNEIIDYGIQNTLDAISETGITIASCMIPFQPTEISEEVFHEEMSKFAMMAIAMEKIGVIFCSSFIRSSNDQYKYEEYFDLNVKRWGAVASLLKKHGMKLSLEFLGPKTSQMKKKYPFVRTAEELLPLCKAIGDNVGITFDFWHWYSGSNNKEVFKHIEGVKNIYCVHLNDACVGDVDTLPDKPRKLVRTSGVIDAEFLIQKLKEYNYDGYLLSESFDECLKGLPLEEKLKKIKETIDAALK